MHVYVYRCIQICIYFFNSQQQEMAEHTVSVTNPRSPAWLRQELFQGWVPRAPCSSAGASGIVWKQHRSSRAAFPLGWRRKEAVTGQD